MKLKKVYIYPNLKASEAEKIINDKIKYISEHGWIPEVHLNREDVELDYELLIENSVRVGEHADTLYTLLINIEEKEESE